MRTPIDRSKTWAYDRFARFQDFPSDSEMMPVPIADLVLAELRVDGNGKDCELYIRDTDGRRIDIPFSSSHLKIATEGSVLTEVLRGDDRNMCVRYTAARLVLREFLIHRDAGLMDADSWERFRQEIASFRTDAVGVGLPKAKMTLMGESPG
jgi:hypothetical protein